MKNQTYTTKVETREECFITLPDELVEKNGWTEGTKFSIKEFEDGSIHLSPYKEIEVDLDDNVFLELAKRAHEQDITFNELCNQILKEQLKRAECK